MRIMSLFLLTSAVSCVQASPIVGFFSVPGATFTSAEAVNNFGVIAGFYADANSRQHGFIRSADGSSYTTIDFPGAKVTATDVFGINDLGDVVGTYYDGSGHAFIRSANGIFAAFDLPGLYTSADAINNNRLILGSTDKAGFLRRSDGTYETFNVPGHDGGFVQPSGGINDAGVVVGTADSAGDDFIRSSDGTSFIIFNPPGLSGSEVFGINNQAKS
jgi:hypothetical protein